MIVVLGSRHDPVSSDLVRRWPAASLCSAEDLATPGWVWPLSGSPRPATWVVDGNVVADDQVSGVFVRRSTVHAEELLTTHAADRSYLAAEAHAFLTFVLARTSAIVVNPIDDGGAFGEVALRPEHWMAVAASSGHDVAPLRVRSGGRSVPPEPTTIVEVVGDLTFDDAGGHRADVARELTARLGLLWAVVAFDREERVSAIGTRRPPSPPAAAALGRLLAGRSAA